MKRKHIVITSVGLFVLLFSFTFYQIKKNNEYKQIAGITHYNSEDISDLAVLCKVWGYLKYYHPAVVEGKYNWDDELIKMMQKILKSKNKENRNQILSEWVTSLGEFTQDTLPKINPDSVKMHPDLDWIKDKKELGKLSDQLEKIKTAKRQNDTSFYVGFKKAQNPFFHEKLYPEMSYPDASYRLLSLFRYWNIIQYYFPYKYLIGEDWKKELPEFIPQFINAKNELEYKLILLKLIARIHDSHAFLYDPTIEKHKGDYIVPLLCSYVENKFIVTDTLVYNIEKQYPLKVGDIILKINGKSIENIISERLPYTSGSNLPSQLRNLAFDLLRSQSNSITVSFTRANKILTKKIPCNLNNQANFQNVFQKNKPLYQVLSKDRNIGYLYLGSSIGGTVPDLHNTIGLIIDLRCYPTEKVKGYMDMQELYEKPKKFAKFTATNFQHPGLFECFEEYYTDIAKTDTTAKFFCKGFYKGKVVILVNELTQSHAEFMTMMYRCSPTATVIGSTTAGADGNISFISLPGNVQTGITGLGVYYPDGRETQRIGIVPDIVVKPTIKGIREGRDEVLEKAIELIEKK
ncbi:MAG: S41 family peptidase [Paludibacteraceae bacterium]